MSHQVEHQRFTVEAYHRMAEVGILSPDSKVELIQGEIVKISPRKSEHASLVDVLAEELIITLRGKAIIRVRNPVHINDISEPEPDIVVAHYQSHRFRHAHPSPHDVVLIIEVSDTSLSYDREIKTPLYAEVNIPMYWIINIPEKQVEIYQKPVRGQYTQHHILFADQKLTLPDYKWEMDIASLFE